MMQVKNEISENLSNNIINDLGLPSRKEALYNIHLPRNTSLLIQSQKRLKFEELFFLQLHLLKLKIVRSKKLKGYSFISVGD